MTPQVSIVIPAHNEAGNLLPLLESVVAVMAGRGTTCEIVVVNDASTDATSAEIAAAQARWPQCRELRLPRRRGQAAALLFGLHAAHGPLIATLDGDGQNDPRDLPALLDLVESNTLDVACGWRVDRHDSWLRRIMSRIANVVRRRYLHDQVHDAGCQLRVFRAAVREALFPFELLQSFLPAIAVAAGFRVGERPVGHHARQRGDSKYGAGQLWWKPAMAMLTLRRRLRAPGRR
jgi:dolichol-phosphate mannosyltransferase